MHIFIPCIPPKSTAQQKGVRVVQSKGKKRAYAMHYKKKNVQAAHDTFAELFAPHAPSVPLDGPLKVVLTFLYPFRKSEKKSVVASGFKWKDVRPDSGNIAKEPLDVLTELCFWKDDSISCDETIRKAWCSVTGIIISAEKMIDAPPKDVAELMRRQAGI